MSRGMLAALGLTARLCSVHLLAGTIRSRATLQPRISGMISVCATLQMEGSTLTYRDIHQNGILRGHR